MAYGRKSKRAPRARRTTTRPAKRVRFAVKRRYRKAKAKARLGYSIFPRILHTTLLYKDTGTISNTSGLTSYAVARLKCNSLTDLDYDNVFANKQPLFFDQLFNASVGPYKQYKVNAWKTVYKVYNTDSTRALSVYFDQGSVNTYVDADTPQEMKNRPGVISKILTPSGGAKPMCYISKYNIMKNFLGLSRADYSLAAGFTVDPTTLIVSTLLATTIDGSTTAFSCQVEVSHIFYVTCMDIDANIS